MAVVTTNLGVITAYGDAVAAGYTGTKAEWQALMANYATVGQQAAQDAQTASQAAQTATTKAGEASQSATRAEQAASSITTPDATLTQAGVAADAKATGDEIGELKSGFTATELQLLPYIQRNSGVMNYAGSSWIYTDNPLYQHVVLPVNPGEYFKITQGGSGISYWAFLRTYSVSSAPDLSSRNPARQNNSAETTVPSDAHYLYVNVKDNGTETIPDELTIGNWSYTTPTKDIINKILTDYPTVIAETVQRNTNVKFINNNRIVLSKDGFANGSVVVGFEEPDIITLSGEYTSGAQRITTLNGALEANKTYTFFVKNEDGLKQTVGIASSSGFITDGTNRIETSDFSKAIVFTTSNAHSGLYAYIRITAGTLNNKLSVYCVEGEYTASDFYNFLPYKSEYDKSYLYGKKVAFYGDSVTQGFRWCQTLANRFGFDATNCGVGGTAVAVESGRENTAMCTATRMDGQYSEVVDPNTGETTYEGIAIPSDVEVIFVEGAVNDWGRNIAIGSEMFAQNPDNTTFAGACHQMFKLLTQKFPNAEIIVVGTPYCKWANRAGFIDNYGILNGESKQSLEYGDIMLDIAGKWGCKGINIGRLNQINDVNISSYTSDGIHPNAAGAAIIAETVSDYLLTL